MLLNLITKIFCDKNIICFKKVHPKTKSTAAIMAIERSDICAAKNKCIHSSSIHYFVSATPE